MHPFVFILIGAFLFQEVHPAKILSVAFIQFKSHKIIYEPLLHELAKRGHEVTVLSPIRGSKNVKNLKEILTFDFEAMLENNENEGKAPDFFKMKEEGKQMNPFMMLDVFGGLCSKTYDLPHVQSLMKQKFDLVIISGILNECAAGYLWKLNTSFIQVTMVQAPSWNIRDVGGSYPTSFVPNLFTGYHQKMTFLERTFNLIKEISVTAEQDYYYKPHMERIYRKKLGDPNIPSVAEIMRNTSLIISNGHFSLGTPRPFLPDVIDVGGMHCRPAQPLPKELEDFVNSSGDDGFIFFSMGSALKASKMPETKRKEIVKAFSKLKQKILWKWETETMPDVPKNVKLSKWLPQQDILGHRKIKMFVTHGGLGGTTEAVYHGVPLVGIPMLGDQTTNMNKAKNLGFAESLDWNDLTSESLLNAIQLILNDIRYKENALKLSKVFRDQPNEALDRAVFWTEYVIRHKGAIHLRSAARELNFFQYHSIDVIAFIFASITGILYIIYVSVRFICRKLCNKSTRKDSITVKEKRK